MRQSVKYFQGLQAFIETEIHPVRCGEVPKRIVFKIHTADRKHGSMTYNSRMIQEEIAVCASNGISEREAPLVQSMMLISFLEKLYTGVVIRYSGLGGMGIHISRTQRTVLSFLPELSGDSSVLYEEFETLNKFIKILKISLPKPPAWFEREIKKQASPTSPSLLALYQVENVRDILRLDTSELKNIAYTHRWTMNNTVMQF